MSNYIITTNNELYHYGVKGMKWGVRKKRYNSEYDNDIILKKGSTIQNISAKKERDLNKSMIYGAHTKKDRLNYKSYYADKLKTFDGFKTVYQNDLKVVKDIKIPSQKKAVEMFKDTFSKDPEGMAKCIAKTQADLSFFGNVGKTLKMDKGSRLYRKYMHAGEEWMNTKGYENFVSSLVSEKSAKARNAYFDTLIGNGYGGMLDINDINNTYKSESPVIIINPNKNLKRGSAVKLSLKEINASISKYDELYR